MDNAEQWNEGPEDDFDLLAIVYKFLKHWYWYVLAIGISLAGAYLYLKRSTPVYRVETTVLIKNDKTSNANSNIIETLELSNDKNLDNEIEIFKSRPLVEKVVSNLGLNAAYWHEGDYRDIELYKTSPIKIEITEILSGEPFFVKMVSDNKFELWDEVKGKVGGQFDFSQKLTTPYGKFRVFKIDSTATAQTPAIKVSFHTTEELVSKLIGALQVTILKPKSTLVTLSIESALPQKGKDILQNLLDEYAYSTLEDKNREASNTLRFIEERLKKVTVELGSVEQNVEQYRKAKGITDLSAEASLFLDKVQANDSKLNEIEINLKVLNGVEGYVNSNQVGNIAPATLGVNDPVLTSYINQLSQLESERAKLAQTVQAGNPYLENFNAQMRNIKQAILENLQIQRSNLLIAKNSLQAFNNRLEGTISRIPQKEREFLDIKRQAGVKESLYLLLLQKREETALSYASTVTDSRVVNPPFSIPGPIKPNKKKTYIYAILLGLLLPSAVIVLKELLNNTVQSKKEIESKTGIKVFGEISIFSKEQMGNIIDLKNRTFISEQVRMIRSNMQYLFYSEKEGRGHTIIITSSTEGEGKSSVVANLANALALLDKKVIILGLDLRKPKVNEYMNVTNAVGISNYLIGQAKEEDIIQATPHNNLFIAPSGPIPPNPSELLSTKKIGDLIDYLRKRYDYILLDTPPITLVTDTLILAPLGDATFFIVRHEKTLKLHLKTLSEYNKKQLFKSSHIIFNAVNYKNSAEYGYGYGYSQYEAYGSEAPPTLVKKLLLYTKLFKGR